MSRKVVFVHGRSQEHLDSVALKQAWVSSLSEGLAQIGLSLPLADQDIRFPYYGDTLFELAKGESADKVAKVIIRGDNLQDDEREFVRSVLDEMRQRAGITDAQLAEVARVEALEQGPLNWTWVRHILKTIDSHVPGGSGTGIVLATNDVYQYLKSTGVRDKIEEGVRAAFLPGEPTVVVGHSLGTVVAYNLLRREGHERGWVVPLFITLGSPLAVTAIKRSLRPIQHPACVSEWYNAMDNHDIVALYPLDSVHFGISPAIENNTTVHNQTSNRHGISGYLNDKNVARRIYAALEG